MEKVSRPFRMWFGAAVVVVAGVVITRALLRSPPPPPPRNPGSEAPSGGVVLMPVEEYEFEIRPKRATLSEVMELARERVVDAARDLPAAESLSSKQVESLAATFARRLGVMLSASYEEWLTLVRDKGGEPPPDMSIYAKGTTLPADNPKEVFEYYASRLEFAPLSLKHLVIRPLRVDGLVVYEHPRPALFFRAMLRASYPSYSEFDLALTDVYEVVLPVHYSSSYATSPDVPAHMAVTYVWDANRSDWIPFDLMFYPNGPGARRMRSPAF